MKDNNKDIGYIIHKVAMLAKNNFSNKLNVIGITPAQFSVLKVIHYAREDNINSGLSPASIAARLEIDRPTASGIIDRLQAQGWVKRRDNPIDKRSFFIIATDKAANKFEEIEAIGSESFNTMVNGFTKEEIDSLKNLLLRVKANFEKQIE